MLSASSASRCAGREEWGIAGSVAIGGSYRMGGGRAMADALSRQPLYGKSVPVKEMAYCGDTAAFSQSRGLHLSFKCVETRGHIPFLNFHDLKFTGIFGDHHKDSFLVVE